jgi:uncharacterized protein
MTTVFAFFFMLAIVAAMSVGVMLGRKPIAGSCGGMKALGMDMQCDICGGDPKACDGQGSAPAARAPADAGLGVDATRRPSRVRTL